MSLFNRFNGDLRKGEGNREKKVVRGRKNDVGNRRAKSDRFSLTERKLGLESLEERQLLSVNPIGNAEYQDIRDSYSDISLPEDLSQINVIELTDLSAASLQAAVDFAATTESDDLIVVRTDSENYTIDLESTAITINIDSEKYGELTILGRGTDVLTIEAVDSNAFTVLNGDVTFDGALIYNYTNAEFSGDMIVSTRDANVTLGDSLVIVKQIAATDPVTGDVTTSYQVDRVATPEELELAGMSNATAVSAYRTIANPHTDGEDDFNAVRNSVHCVMRTQYDYFGYDPATYMAVGGGQIYDAECPGYAGWVGTVANMLSYTGWAQQAGFSRTMTFADGSTRTYDSVEDAVADYFMNAFIDAGGGTAYWNGLNGANILDYFFSGDDQNAFGRNLAHLTNEIESGGFFQTLDFGKVGGYTPASDSMLQEMLSALRYGNAVTMEVETSDSYGNVSREYLSVWGYVYDPDSREFFGGLTNESATTVGLICSNPLKGSYEQEVTDSRYNNEQDSPRTLRHYVDRDSTPGDVYDTYHTYLLTGAGADLRLVHAPYTYLDDNGGVHGAIDFPEGFSFYGQNNQRYNTFTSRVVGFSWLQQYNDKLSSVPITEESVLSLESMPGNTDNVIYLHFGGVEGEGWDGNEHPQFNLDNVDGFGPTELKIIEEVYRRVAEDYAPFNVNVTTNADVWEAAQRGIRCVIGGYDPDKGGVSHVGSYGDGKADNYVYPFSLNLNPKYIAEAATHEVGHAFGLSHDGYEHNEYYSGQYSGNTTWAPIMGTGYYSLITQWSKGEYVGATQLEDDIAIIAANVGYRDDEIGDTIDTAADLRDYYVDIDINTPSSTAGTYYVENYIIKDTDYDVYSFVSNGGTYVVDVSGDGYDDRFIDPDYSWTYRRHADTENAVFAGLYYAQTYDYTNLNLKVELLDSDGEILLLDMNGDVLKLSFGESIVVRDSDYYFYVVDQFGRKVYDEDGNLKEGYQAVDDSVFSTFSHFVTPELEAGETYYIRVSGVGEGNPATTGYSDYGSLGKYTLQMHESYENFYLDDERVDVTDVTYATGVDNVLNWREAFVYAGRRLEDGSTFLGNTLTFNESLAGSTLTLQDTLHFSRSTSIVGQPYSAKRFVLDAMDAWDTEHDRPGITIDAQEKFRAVYVDNTTIEMYGFTITGGVAETTNVIYLYFGGLAEGDTGWSGELHPAYDIDGDPTTFSEEELELINQIYLQVAEDYAPYNVTVTTDQAVFEAATNAIRVVVGGTGNGRGGVAYMNSFGTSKQDCYVFPNSVGSRSAKNIAEAITHEVGHTLGLGHDGLNDQEYYGGSSLWGPIMGAAYGPILSQWSKGEYAGATNTQDDVSIIAGRLGFREDDHGDTMMEASPLSSSYLHTGNLIEDGLITDENDVDFFRFVATDSSYVIDVSGSGADFSNTNENGYAASLNYTNLDLLVKVYDESGTLIYTCDPTDSFFAHFQIDDLEIGDTYYISVEGTGFGDPTVPGEGYSPYGSIGQYFVTMAATTLENFVGEERYQSSVGKKAIQNGAVNANYQKGQTYDQVGQTNNGGGIYNHYGWLTIGNSVIAGNRAYKAGGGIYNQGGEYNNRDQHDGWLYLVNTEIVGNIVTSENAIGGGIYNEDGAVATLVNVTVAGNKGGYSGGGLQNAGRVEMYNTTIAENTAEYGADVYTESGNSTRAYSSLIGDESRNASLLAQRGGQDTINADGYSIIGTSQGTSPSSPVVRYDGGYVAYRDYDVADWSTDLWRAWNLRLTADSLAVDLGTNHLSTTIDYTNPSVRASAYARLGITRYVTEYHNDLAGQARVGGSTIDAGAYELLSKPELTGYVPTSAGSDVVNNWEHSIVVSRAIDDQTGSIAPFLVDEKLYLNLSFINEGAKITQNFETTVYLWKFDAYTKRAEMYDQATQETGLPIMTVKVEFDSDGAMPGGGASIVCTNLSTGAVQTLYYDGSTSYMIVENVELGTIEELVAGLIEQGKLEAQNEEGYYLFGYGIDSTNVIDELRENNNFFKTTSYFDVVESPVSLNDSIVVTTNLDVVDPYDGLISLREAVEIYAGSYYYSEVALQEGDTFEANGVTYVVHDGKFYVDMTSAYHVYPGEQFYVDTTVETSATWNEVRGYFVDAEGLEIDVPIGTTHTVDDVTYVYNGTDWLDSENNVYNFANGEVATWTADVTVTVTYVQNVYVNSENKTVDVPEGTTARIDGEDYVLVDGVWTRTEVTNRYGRDEIQSMGVFTLADGSEVAVVNGVFRRVATNDVAIIRDGDVVTLANGETAVYDYAQDRFVVTEVTTWDLTDGDLVVIDGETLTFVTDDYVDLGGYEYMLEEGTEVTLTNGYKVVYEGGKFLYSFQSQTTSKIAAGSEVIFNGESYTYKAGLALVRRVSRESNAVVFDPALDGSTFVLVDGPLTLDKTFTLDCVDPDGNLLDLTITSSTDDPCLFSITKDADATVLNFKFVNAHSTEAGSIFENEGELTVQNVLFSNNVMEKGNLIYNAENAKLTVLNSTFENNTAIEGALIYNLGDASIIGTYDEETDTTVYTSFIGDSAYLGPIYSEDGELSVQYASFQETSAENGGAVHVNGGSAIIANSVFEETSATDMGGAIFATNGANLQIDEAQFTNTTATDGGALVAHSGSTVNIAATTFDGATATDRGGAILNVASVVKAEDSIFANASATNGGAVYNSGDMTFVSSVFDGNTAAEQGGAIYSEDASGLTFQANEDGDPAVIFTNNAATDGGAFYSETPVLVDGDLIATGNTASDSFGAGYVHGRMTVTGAATFENNSASNVGALGVMAEAEFGATRFANNSSTGDYGAAYFGTSATVESLELVDNVTAGEGGALTVLLSLTIGDYALISGNVGGGIVASDSVQIGGDATIHDNQGGAIVAGESVVIDGDADVRRNTATEGAAINTNGALIISGSAVVSSNRATDGFGGAFKVGSFEIKGELTASNNSATDGGGFVYSEGDVKIVGGTLRNNRASRGTGGAIYANGEISVAYAHFFDNRALVNAGAIYAAGGLKATNTLFTTNSAVRLGGAIYAEGETSLVNVTIADNTAQDGAGLYNAGVATVDNSILANNVAAGTGYDLFTATDATTTLRNSLLANVAKYGDVIYTLDAAYRSLLGVDPKLDENYRLTAGSVAINAGSNELDGDAETDLAGAPRRVGLTIDGIVRSVDMGAYEYETIVAPDLAIVEDSVDYWKTEVLVGDELIQLDYFLSDKDVCIDFNVKNIGDSTVIDNFHYNVTLVGVDASGEVVYEMTQDALSYAKNFDVFDWLNQEDWIDAGSEQRFFANFGILPAGFYTVTVALDVEGVGDIYEWGEEDGYEGEDNNNLYTSTFTVREAPSVVVTTAEDTVDSTDELTSLREAIAAAADCDYVMTFLVEDGTQFTTESGEVLTVSDGWLVQTVDVVYKDGVPVDLQDGDEFLLNGETIYYHYQLNGGYFAYENGDVADVSDGVITYPDGTSASFELQTSQYIHYVDGSELNEQEGARYTYNVLRLNSGDVVLEDGMEFDVSNVKFTYIQNGTYPGGAFLFEDGTIVEYESGAELAFANLAIGALSTRNARVETAIKLEDGSMLLVENGIAKQTYSIGSDVVFAEDLTGSTITLDAEKGELLLDGYANLGPRADNGEDLYVPRNVSIFGEDREIVVSGDMQTRIMNIAEEVTSVISDLTLEKGLAEMGGAILNNGNATLVNVNFNENSAIWQKSSSGGDTLTSGLGGAVANYGSLVVDGGAFTNNGVLPGSEADQELGGATEFGGAIYSAGDLTIANASFTGNSAYAGGAVAAIEGTLTVSKSTFDSNTAERAGAIYALVPTTVIASSFTSNSAQATSYASRNMNGGAIYAREDITFELDPESESTVAVIFDGNSAEVAGALYAEGNVTANGDIVATNNAAIKNEEYAIEVANNYGAFYVAGTLSVDGSATFTGNSADGSYGALYASRIDVTGDLTANDNTAKGNVGAFYAAGATIGGNLTANNNEAQDGSFGAVRLTGDLDVGGDATLNGNKAKAVYGAMFVRNLTVGGDLEMSGNSTEGSYAAGQVVNALNVAGSATFDGNTANGAVGAIMTKSFVVGADATFTNNHAGSKYGAAYIAGLTEIGGNATISGNTSDGDVAGVYTIGMDVTGDLVTTDNAAQGSYGGLRVNGDLNVGGAANLSGNSAASYGAAFVNGAMTIVGNATVANNTAAGNVGAVAAKTLTVGTETVASNLEVTGNSAGNDFGAIYVDYGVHVYGALTATDNTATAYVETSTETTETVDEDGRTIVTTVVTRVMNGRAAALHVEYGDADIDGDATFTNNAAGTIGAVSVSGDLNVGGNLTFESNAAKGETIVETTVVAITYNEDGEVESEETLENKVETIDHGGFYGAANVGGSVSVGGDAAIVGNTATMDVGAIAAQNIDVVGSLLLDANVADGDSGALALTGSLTVGENATITNNAAGNEGGAITANGDVVIGGDAVITGNTAATVGAIYAENVAIGGNAEIAHNKAEESYGAIYANASISVGGTTTITENEAGQSYGAVATNGDITLGGSATISGNKAGVDYGAVFANGALSIVGDTTISGNTAGGNVGAVAAGSVSIGAEDATVLVEITGNEAGRDYGAVYAEESFTVYGSVNVDSNKAATAPIVEVQTSVETLENGAIATTTTTKTTIVGKTGALHVESGDATITDAATFTNNTAGENGALYVGGALRVGQLTLSNNEAIGGVTTETEVVERVYDEEGNLESETTTSTTSETTNVGANHGAAFVGGAITVDGDATITSNKAFDSVGAVEATSLRVGGTLLVSENTATNNYGALKLNGSLNAMGDATFDQNTAGGMVGALSAYNATIDGAATFTNNTAGTNFGALRLTGALAIGGDATFTSNKAEGGAYGVGFVKGSATIGSDALVSSNTASGNVGGLMVDSLFAVAGALTATDNVAGGAVGALQISGDMEIGGDATITGNEAGGKYGALYVNGAANIVGDAVVENNRSDASIGAIYAHDMTVGGTLSVKSNEAAENVGAIMTGGPLTVAGAVEISNNRAGGNTGAISALGMTIGTADAPVTATIVGNEAGADYGAIYMRAGSFVLYGDLTATNNKAATVANVTTETTTDESGNVETTTTTTVVVGKTGVMHVANGSVKIVGNATITENEAATNGALYVQNKFDVTGDLLLDKNAATGSTTVETTTITRVYDEEGELVSEETTESTTEVTHDGAHVGAAYVGGVMLVGGDATITNNTANNDVGAVYAGSVAIAGAATISDNSAGGNVGAIKTTGNLTIDGAATITGNSATASVGALETTNGTIFLKNATITNNTAGGDAGAIRAKIAQIVNSLVANNSATGNAGAIFATELTLLNVTVAGNTAANGGALYIESSATIDNSILAGNSITKVDEGEDGEEGEVVEEALGVEIYALDGSNITLRNSLIQNYESTGENAFGESWLVEEYRSFIGVDPLFVDAENGDFTLQATSPIINGGSNELAATVGDYDLVGNDRYVGLAVDGKIFAIDLGAYEYQTITAPDLTFGEEPVEFWYSTLNGVENDFYYAGQNVVLDFSMVNVGDHAVVDKFNVTFTVEGVTATGENYSQTVVQRYAKGSDYFDWLREADWIQPGETATYARQNLGKLPVGVYTLVITLDSGNEIVEYGEEDGSEADPNNVHTVSFEVHEAPSVVVNSAEDGEYNPLDDKITLREAVEVYCGPSTYTYRTLIDSGDYVDENHKPITVVDGEATADYNIVTIGEDSHDVIDGETFGYRNTYVTYNAQTATFTYPDGTTARYEKTDPSSSLIITDAYGAEYVVKQTSMIEYLDNIGEPYSDSDIGVYVDVVESPDGSLQLLSELVGDAIPYEIQFLTYRDFVAVDANGVATPIEEGAMISLEGGELIGAYKNGAIICSDGSIVLLKAGDRIGVDGVTLTWVGAAFVSEDVDGAVTPFAAGDSIELLDGAILEMSVETRQITGEVTAWDGSKVTLNEDGSAIVVVNVGNEITFSDELRANDAVITLDGTEITIAKDLTIDATGSQGTPRITVDGAGQSRIFTVNANTTAEITSLNMRNGSAVAGGAILNYGTLTVSNSLILGNKAIEEGTLEPGGVLREGLAGAIYNAGNLTLNGGRVMHNEAAFFGGAIVSLGSLNIDGTSFISNKSALNGGALFVLNADAKIANAIFQHNVAERNGGAIAFTVARDAGALDVVNTLIVDNKGTRGGGIYVYGGENGTAVVHLGNVTVADNTANLGGGIYAERTSVELANTIVATNKATNGVDFALFNGATVTASHSLIGNGENIVADSDALTVENSFVGTNDRPVDPAFGEEYALTAASPAINTGSNAQAVYSDGTAIEYDVYGNPRIVGVEQDGEIYAVDMGAVEYQTVVASDLTFPEDRPALTGWYASLSGEDLGEFVEGWDVCFEYVFGNFGPATLLNSFTYTITVAKVDENGEAVEGTEKTYTQTYGEEVNGFLPQDQWLATGELFSDSWNLGTFDAGHYAITITLDTEADIPELNEDNNVYSTTFSVSERPTLVVTTAEDVVDRYDGVTSLREAISRVSPTGETVLTATRPLTNGDTFTLAAFEELGIAEGTVVTYNDGAITYVDEEGETIELQSDVEYPLTDGSSVTFNGDRSVNLAEYYGSAITFAENVEGATIVLEDGELTIDRNMEILGDGSSITIDANEGRAFMVAHGDNVVISGLTVTNADADKGAAIYNASTGLTLLGMSFDSNTATDGAAIYNAPDASIEGVNLSFTANSGVNGAAIYNAGTIELSQADFTSNEAVIGALYNVGYATLTGANFTDNVATDRAGAIYNAGTLNVVDSTFETNTAEYGGAVVNYQGTASFVGTTFSGNEAFFDAGAIDNYGQLTLTNTELTGNSANGYGGAVYNSQSSANSTYTVSLDGATFSNNTATKGGALYNAARSLVTVDGASSFQKNSSTEDGGAFYNLGTFNADFPVTFDGNTATGDGGALYNGAGGRTTLTGASFASNLANNGGAVYNASTFNATTTNFESNVATVDGGAVNGGVGSSTSISNSLVWKNSAGVNGGAFATAGALKIRSTTIGGNLAEVGGGVNATGAVSIYNSIIADNYAETGFDLYSTRPAKVYYSLLGTVVGAAQPTMIQSKTGFAGFVTAPVFEDGALTNADEIVLSLNSDSPAVNSGASAWALDATGSYTLETDFAGNPRICSNLDAIDMGAFEFPFEEPSAIVTTGEDVYDLTDGEVSLREAIDYAKRLGLDTVTISSDVTDIVLRSTLEINDSIKIVTETGEIVTVTTNGYNGSVIAVGTTTEGQNANVEIENIKITGGYFVNPTQLDDPNYVGGGVCNYATLTLNNVTVDGNTASYGGGVYNAGTMRVVGSTITNNTANYYGGVYNRGFLYIEDTTIAGNSARYYGGGVGSYSDATIVNSTIIGNLAASGAGVYAQINATDLLTSETDMAINLVNCTVAGNVAREVGAGVWANHLLNVTNSIVYGNVASSAEDVFFSPILSTSAANFRYSNIGSSNVAISGVGVKSVDPNFKDFTAPTADNVLGAWNDWNLSLSKVSTLIDAGYTPYARGDRGALTTDHAGDARVVGKAVDMGAYEDQGNAAPTDITIVVTDDLSANSVPGDLVATLEAVDPDEGDTFTYELVFDETGALKIDGDKVVVDSELLPGDYSAIVRAIDQDGAFVEKSFEFTVADPSATDYATPVITTIGVSTTGDLVVAWETDDPAKEYVVEYRVQGETEWNVTGALTGTYGELTGANFNVGDVVEARIKALSSSTKNESEWSEIVEHEIVAPVPSYNVSYTESTFGNYYVVNVTIESNSEPYAWWAIDWQDGSEVTSVTGLSMSQTLSHIYEVPGVYTPVLFVDAQPGVDLGAVVVDLPSLSDARLDTAVATENVFSAVAPVSVGGERFVDNSSAEAVDSFFAEMAVEDVELDDAIFDDNFVIGIFE